MGGPVLVAERTWKTSATSAGRCRERAHVAREGLGAVRIVGRVEEEAAGGGVGAGPLRRARGDRASGRFAIPDRDRSRRATHRCARRGWRRCERCLLDVAVDAPIGELSSKSVDAAMALKVVVAPRVRERSVDGRAHVGGHGAEDDIEAGLRDSRLLAGNVGQRRPEPVGVIERDPRDGGRAGEGEHVGRIEPAADPDFDDGEVDLGIAKREERREGRRLEERELRRPVERPIERVFQRRVVERFPREPDALGEPAKVR